MNENCLEFIFLGNNSERSKSVYYSFLPNKPILTVSLVHFFDHLWRKVVALKQPLCWTFMVPAHKHILWDTLDSKNTTNHD